MTMKNKSKPEYIYEIPVACQAREVPSEKPHDLVYCLVANPFCRYLLPFGARKLCRHPQRTEIAAQTESIAG